MATAEQLKAIRKKAGIGEFSKKPASSSTSPKKTASRGNSMRKTAVYDWNQDDLVNERFGGSSPAITEE